MPEEPLMPGVGILALVPDEWGPQWQRRHHVLSRLARYFRVAWIAPARPWRELISARGASAAVHSRGAVSAPFLVLGGNDGPPKAEGPAWLANTTFDWRLRLARQALSRNGCTLTVLHLWRPEFVRALRSLPHDLSCYHIDDEYSFSEHEHPVDPQEHRLIASVDQVFIHSPALLEKKGRINPNTIYSPNGVDYLAYSQPCPAPADIASIPHPRIGYAGILKPQLDWALLDRLSMRHESWSFVFVGSEQAAPRTEVSAMIQRLSERPNVYFLGSKPTEEFARYPQHFDVCVMPYRSTAYTRYIYPLKLHESLATGHPTIGTAIRALEDFVPVVKLATTANEWSAAIASALTSEENCAEARALRREVARQHDWDVLVHRMAEATARALEVTAEQRCAAHLAFPPRPLSQRVPSPAF